MRKLALMLAVLASALVATLANAEAAEPGDAIGDWRYICGPQQQDPLQCGINQTVDFTTPRGNTNRILSLLIRRETSRKRKGLKTMLFVVVPLGIFIPSGIVAKIDDGEEFKILITACNTDGCGGAAELDDAKVDALRKGNTMRIAYKFNPQGNSVVVPASLRGVTKALAALP